MKAIYKETECNVKILNVESRYVSFTFKGELMIVPVEECKLYVTDGAGNKLEVYV